MLFVVPGNVFRVTQSAQECRGQKFVGGGNNSATRLSPRCHLVESAPCSRPCSAPVGTASAAAHRVATGAVVAPVRAIRSAAASWSWRPRRPAET
ncbi:hypothetical protein DLE60_11230 [Micromonospora globispora]|uniref:Uncharacterized protein n=1 Tax=Micromonospora globispora TaxID=1450148 RepID=A0A317KFJ3_9ACTN|nr:hypothetical protein DLJ46_03440 [Micromonospora globispora]PWU60421.1 hypothetical protein DLE60_11230 [Micromonospora globispora]RQW86188.1 hypothetical protein DKL51_27875 [Micromonospora globispora]